MRARTLCLTVALSLGHGLLLGGAAPADAIRPWPKNPSYWQYRGEPVLLLGGSRDDNLFQIPDLEAHLDTMKAAGGNYIRNTMSDRPDGSFEVYAFKRLPNGKYDLDQWNDEYWQRFARMLALTEARGIIVQIEVWDRFDYADHREPGNWARHPYNPANNINYTHEQSGLKAAYRSHPGANEQPFFFTVPALDNNQTVLKYQRAQVDKMLSLSLKHGNVLYCMDNETSGRPEWGEYWAKHIKARAREAGVEVFVTEMWDDWNPKGASHRHTFDRPDLYTFVDVSQNNHNKGQAHWDNLQWVRGHIAAGGRRPINTVKIYGADTGRFGNHRDGQERFWRNILGGAASTRFHRPDSGLGLSDIAQAHLRSMRLLAAEFDVFSATPDADSTLLLDRKPNAAYLSYREGQQYAVFFPAPGAVKLDLTRVSGRFAMKWLDVLQSRWEQPAAVVKGGAHLDLTSAADYRVCLLTRVEGGE